MKKLPRKILVIKPSSLGDVVHSLPFLNSLRSGFPRAQIHWVIAKGLEGLLDGHPMIDRLIIIRKDAWKRVSRAGETVREISKLLREVGRERYDIAVDLQGLLRSGLIAAASRAPVRIGFAEAREGSRIFYTEKVHGGKEVHAVDRYLKVAAALGCDASPVIFPFPLMKNGLERIRGIKEDLIDYAVIVPGARWETKIWPAEHFGRVASMLPIRSVVVGGAGDADSGEMIAGISGGKALNLAGKTDLRELVEIIRGARLVISNDSGPMHVAAGLNVPVVAVFGPTSPAKTGPYGSMHIIIKSAVSCSPCFRKRCGDIKCMRDIDPDIVFQRARGIL